MNLTLSLTHACNLACTYCYAAPHSPRVMTWDVAKRGIDLAFAQRPRKELVLGFFGGEPLLQWPLLQQATEYACAQAHQAGIAFTPTVTTNGLLLTEDRLQWLNTNGFFPALSLDGNRAMHEAARPTVGGRSSFAASERGVRRALKVFPDLEVIAVIDPANVAHLADGVRYLGDELGVLDISLNPNFSGSWTPETFAIWDEQYRAIGAYFLERYRANRPLTINFIDIKIITHLKRGYDCADRCSFGEQEFAVAPSGRLYPCERVIGDDTDSALCLGDVFTGIATKKRFGILAQRGNMDEPCRTCAIQPRCMNWCGCVNYATSGAIDRTDGVLCFHERLSVEIADQLAGTLFAEQNAAFLDRFYQLDLTASAEVDHG